MTPTIKNILEAWFGEIREEKAYLDVKNREWFSGGKEADDRLRDLFGGTVEIAMRGDWDGWASTPLGRLALILVLDQFPRQFFRGTAKAFAQDAKALALCLQGLDAGVDRLLHPVQRMFFYLPLEHSESLELQRKSISLFERLARDAPAPLRPGMEDARDYAIRHHAIIERFGRFPHRNAVLGRKTSDDEAEFLVTSSRF